VLNLLGLDAGRRAHGSQRVQPDRTGKQSRSTTVCSTTAGRWRRRRGPGALGPWRRFLG
jgi:hypothetical protein